ncbi:ATPase [Haloferax mediterranei ATCC 33500]|uniref:ATPase n=1 Tax=Haloferax mediterranei (strain ATCC 33500 / DSM 1411 / JCM 8866 / NBRC 14739 / NCIMB 2177 / R-4) TaxID=523841 RepID=I3R8S2_HALMT|nr:ArsA family ATPase [Haloferax mediterranei]AFK20632.1 transport ATPase (substrate arsenite) [Haloferax mediterranei ATCC 33500]AHZ22883.1 ATPase [Haloferax mediterranei ATCC 33500]EMA03048.1 transport ATPase (substrate arsenite) [Haloferax mediterranei ATCC 33500]MDX5987771.1 ArsA family ATPase [Haloferax mediterranei ATCC 33500]QCQ74250.1 ATPase [Haloferax mediterranei ATCC 33500]
MRKFVFFGGKGGVGKTTISSAYAVKCARAGIRTLLVSTDPAHSTRDVFDQTFTDDPSPVDGEKNLDAMEIDPETEVREHLMETKRAMGDQVSPAMVNEIDRQLEMAHQTPGAHESALFDRFIDVMRSSDDYDRVVFDTSPTGGTLRLLSLPVHLDGWIQRLLHKRKQSVKLFERAAIGNNEPRRMMDGDPIIARLEQRRDDFTFAKETLQADAAFFLVVNPDELSIRETKRAVEQLDSYGLDVRGLAVNRLTPEPDPDEEGRGATFLRNRVETERERLRELREDLSPPLVAAIETRVAEVKGDFLGEVADELDVEIELKIT